MYSLMESKACASESDPRELRQLRVQRNAYGHGFHAVKIIRRQCMSKVRLRGPRRLRQKIKEAGFLARPLRLRTEQTLKNRLADQGSAAEHYADTHTETRISPRQLSTAYFIPEKPPVTSTGDKGDRDYIVAKPK